jgi:dienelactone hydrolase
MKQVLLIGIIACVAVNCLPADPSDVVPESTAVVPGSTVLTAGAKKGCITRKLVATHDMLLQRYVLKCDDIFWHVNVPTKCFNSKKKCGMIMDIPGSNMDASMYESLDYIRKWSKDYMVLQPSDRVTHKGHETWATDHWKSLHDMEAVLREATKKFAPILDSNRVHVSGFSQGGYLAFNLLCRASDIICSIAPAGINSAGAYVGGYMAGAKLSIGGHRNCWLHGNGPKHKRSIMYTLGRHDCFFGPSTFHKTVASVKKRYGMGRSKGKRLRRGKGVNWKRYSKGSVNFEAAIHNYKSKATFYGMHVNGHCIPSTFKPGTPRRHMFSCGRKHGFNWGEQVLAFFKHNQCGHREPAKKGRKH